MSKVFEVEMKVRAVIAAKDEKEAMVLAIQYADVRDCYGVTASEIKTAEDMPEFYRFNDFPENSIGLRISEIVAEAKESNNDGQ